MNDRRSVVAGSRRSVAAVVGLSWRLVSASQHEMEKGTLLRMDGEL